MAVSNTIISLKKSNIPGNIPTSLANGEIAINTADGILFYKDNFGTIKGISAGGGGANSFSTINVSSTLLIARSNTDILSLTGNGAISVTGYSSNDTIVIGVSEGSTSQKGVVQLYDGVISNSTTLAATANSVNAAYTLANTAYNNILAASSTYLTTNYSVQEYTATAGQTIFTVTNGYQKNNIEVFINGILLSSSDYDASSGSSVTLNIGANLGDNVSIAKWYFDTSIYLTSLQNYDEFVATTNQVVFNTTQTYSPGLLKVYRNGILLQNTEFTATNGSTVSLSHAASNNDIIVLHYWGANSINATPVFITANNASNNANAAYLIANLALNTANSAIVTGSNALNTANVALSTANTKISTLLYANLNSIAVSTSTNSVNQVLDSFSTSTYRTVKYLVQVTNSTNYQSSEILLVQDGSFAYVTEYASIATNGTLMSFDANVSSGMVNLLMSPVNNINTINLVKTSIVV
jgi:Phage tail fibre repeat